MASDDTLGMMDQNQDLNLTKEQQQEGAVGDSKVKKVWEEFRQRIAVCKQYRRKQISNWVSNIDYRRGKPFSSQTDEDRVAVNLDWPLTKSKHASLYSQTPQVHVDHPPQTTGAPWVYGFEQRLNDTFVAAGIEAAMDEVMPDVINAAGVGVILVSHEAITEQVEVPSVDFATMPPEVVQQVQQSKMMPDGSPVPMETVPRVVDHRYMTSRISPADFLWPIGFTGSDFDNAPWIGRSGRVTWAQAQVLFGLTEADKHNVLGYEDRTLQDKLTHDIEKDKVGVDEEVSFDEIFYKEYQYDPGAKNFSSIHHMVFITGKDEPVIDEAWQGQKAGQDGQLVGAIRYPIRVLTLTYITDEAIPPSDSAIGRSQVNEINKSRTQMILQRERSLPLRWVDVNRIDPAVTQALMRGTWQQIIPVQGNGENSIGEVARASMPQEDFTFDTVAKNDLNEMWQIGPNQQGNFGQGRQSASEANLVQSNFQTRIGMERAKVAKFVVSVAEVLGGLLCLYEQPESFGQGFDPTISRTLTYSILADSTVLVDSQQRLDRLKEFINFAAKSGYVDVEPVLREVAQLSGLDPSAVIKKPEPAPPVEPTISLRMTGVEDLMNPLTLAFLLKSGQAPDPNMIEQAKKLIQLAVVPPLAPEGAGQVGPDGQPVGGGAPPQQVQPPSPATPGMGEAHPNWTIMDRINTRRGPEGE